jgi:hypothetical protein
MRSHAGLRPPSLRRATSQNPPDYHVELATTSPQPRLDLHPALLANASLYADGGASTLMTTQFANEVGLLRTLARNLILKPSPSGPVTQDFLRDDGPCTRPSPRRRTCRDPAARTRSIHRSFGVRHRSVSRDGTRDDVLSQSFSTSWPPPMLDAILHPLVLRRRPLSTSILRRGLQNWPPPAESSSRAYFALVGPSLLDRAGGLHFH